LGSLADSQNLAFTLDDKLRPTQTTALRGLARCADGTSDGCNITIVANGSMILYMHSYNSKTTTAFIVSGYYK
jgi:hypothetical protein